MERGSKNTLLNIAYTDAKLNNSWWIQSIQRILSVNGYRESINHNPSNLPNIFNQCLKDCYLQTWFNQSNCQDHIKLLKSFKENNYYRSPYLDSILNPRIRSIFTKLRIGNSKLAFSTYNHNTKKPQDCSQCNCLEDTSHFLFSCLKYSDVRGKFNLCTIRGKFHHTTTY